ncbi:MAG: nucleoside phosphorylase [Edaphocola sp.]
MMIEESELIITAQGSIYHLDLRPDELADTVITVGDPARVAQVSKYFDSVEVRKAHREFVSHTGYIGQKRITVLSSGIGPDNIDIVLNELDALANIDFGTRTLKPMHKALNIIRLGTSGSFQANVPVDSMVASTHGIGMDNLLHYYKWEPNNEEAHILRDFQNHTRMDGHPIQPYIAEASIKLLRHLATDYIQGITVTAPGFYAPQGRKLRLPPAFPNLVDRFTAFRSGPHRITNCEMETSAIYGLGKLMGHHCLSINNIIANRINKTFSKDMAAATDKMIRHSLEIMETV